MRSITYSTATFGECWHVGRKLTDITGTQKMTETIKVLH